MGLQVVLINDSETGHGNVNRAVAHEILVEEKHLNKLVHFQIALEGGASDHCDPLQVFKGICKAKIVVHCLQNNLLAFNHLMSLHWVAHFRNEIADWHEESLRVFQSQVVHANEEYGYVLLVDQSLARHEVQKINRQIQSLLGVLVIMRPLNEKLNGLLPHKMGYLRAINPIKAEQLLLLVKVLVFKNLSGINCHKTGALDEFLV